MSKDSHNLDFLRALAVTLVVVDHTSVFLGHQWVHGFDLDWLGELGVAFFFVHTSLVLMLSMERMKRGGWELAKAFYIRRLFRIYPLSIFAVLFIVALRVPAAAIRPGRITPFVLPTLKNLLANLTLTQNLFSGCSNLLGQLWSLPLEVQMYALLPPLFLLMRRWPAACLYGLWPTAVAAALTQTAIPHAWRLNVFAYAPCFAAGLSAYLLAKRIRGAMPSWLWPPLLLAVVFSFSLRPSWKAAWLACLIIGLTVPCFRELQNRILNGCAFRVAKYSYGIYLSHVFCIWLGFEKLASAPLAVSIAVLAASWILIPVALFYAIEKPGIGLGVRLAEFAAAPARRTSPVERVSLPSAYPT